MFIPLTEEQAQEMENSPNEYLKEIMSKPPQNKGLNLNDLGMEIMKISTDGERIALIHSELSEALEADRKDLMSEKLPGRTGIEEELADVIIRILDTGAYMKLNLHETTLEKIAYNATRSYKHGNKKY